MMYAFILGRQADLSIWEIQSVLHTHTLYFKEIFIGTEVYIIETSDSFDAIYFLKELGGTIKIVQGTFREKISEEVFIDLLTKKEGKITYALSFYQGDVDTTTFRSHIKKIQKLGRDLKKYLKLQGLSSRFIESKTAALTSAQVSNHGLIAKGAEFVTILFQEKYFIGKTVSIQSIKGFQERDISKPYRSMQVGMMPPKLARILINVAQVKKEDHLLDPFCGMGTVLLEAMSLGYQHLFGGDIAKEQVHATKENIRWAKEKYHWQGNTFIKQVKVEKLSSQFKEIDVIVTEPFLGKILTGKETKAEIDNQIHYLTQLYKAAFQEFEKVVKTNGKVVMIIPEFHLNNRIYKLHIASLIKGTSFHQQFPPHKGKEVIYKREGQFVARNICLFQKN